MIPVCIEGANIKLIGNGSTVGDLMAIRCEDGFITAWMPTPAELEQLNAGAPVYLFTYAEKFPPTAIGVKQE